MKRIFIIVLILFLTVPLILPVRAEEATAESLPDYTITLVSVGINGEAAGVVDFPTISSDGRLVAFDAPDRMMDETEDYGDIFVKNLDTGNVSRVSVSTSGEQGNMYTDFSQISGNGKFVVFQSEATNLVPDDTNDTTDIFVRDLDNQITTRASVASDGSQSSISDPLAVPFSYQASITPDGRFVVFTSYADNLTPGDINGQSDIFVHDRQTGETSLVSVSSEGVQGNGNSYFPSISPDGRYVSFISGASNFFPDDNANNNLCGDLFLHDRQTGETSLVSTSAEGIQGDSCSWYSFVRHQGRVVIFESEANNLVPNDTNDETDIFLKDTETGEISLISLSPQGEQYPISYAAAVSPNGKYFAFSSYSLIIPSPIPGDTYYEGDFVLVDLETGESKSLLPPDWDPTYLVLDKSVSDDGRVIFSTPLQYAPNDHNDGLWAQDAYLASPAHMLFLPLILK